jgi:hypothetical protein
VFLQRGKIKLLVPAVSREMRGSSRPIHLPWGVEGLNTTGCIFVIVVKPAVAWLHAHVCTMRHSTLSILLPLLALVLATGCSTSRSPRGGYPDDRYPYPRSERDRD